jgi:RES domain-containing protein
VTPLPAAIGGGDQFVIWRLDRDACAATWDSGEGGFRFGGRWNSKGVHAVYCAIDPATAIIEVVVHKGFRVLDTTPHVLTAALIVDTAEVHVVDPSDVPNPNWLRPGNPSAGQQSFGDDLLRRNRFVVIPSVVSTHSWNVLFNPTIAKGRYSLRLQEQFALDTRLHPAP